MSIKVIIKIILKLRSDYVKDIHHSFNFYDILVWMLVALCVFNRDKFGYMRKIMNISIKLWETLLWLGKRFPIFLINLIFNTIVNFIYGGQKVGWGDFVMALVWTILAITFCYSPKLWSFLHLPLPSKFWVPSGPLQAKSCRNLTV